MARHEELPVPTYSSLEPVYGGGSQLEEAQQRFNRIKEKFVEFYGQPPDIYTRSPGKSMFLLCVIIMLDYSVLIWWFMIYLFYDGINYCYGRIGFS